MKVKHNEVTYEGTAENLAAILHPELAINPYTQYDSASKGVVSLQGMHDIHLFHAIRKIVVEQLLSFKRQYSITFLASELRRLAGDKAELTSLSRLSGVVNALEHPDNLNDIEVAHPGGGGVVLKGNAKHVFPAYCTLVDIEEPVVNPWLNDGDSAFTIANRFFSQIVQQLESLPKELCDLDSLLSEIYDYERTAFEYPELGGLLFELKRRVEENTPSLPLYYQSHSKGKVLISDMHVNYLKKAIMWMLKEHYIVAYHLIDSGAYSLSKYAETCWEACADDTPELAAMLREYKNRA